MDIREKLKIALVRDLNLEDVTPEEIDNDAPLFDEGLGLDSLDAIELVILVQRNFGIRIQDAAEAKVAFASVNVLAAHIEKKQE